jgi:O-methyltransferase
MNKSLKTLLKRAFYPWLYPQPMPYLKKERLYLYLDTLYATRNVPGAVVEIGCFHGATAAYAHGFLRGIECPRVYLCVDTFGGFPERQFAEDVKLGTTPFRRLTFSANSKSLVRKLLNHWGCQSIELLQADVVHLDAEALPEKIAVALIDVDLVEPTTAALLKIMPRMAPGGVILVDDCDLAHYKGARIATERVAPNAQFRFGMGIICIPAASVQTVLPTKPNDRHGWAGDDSSPAERSA